MKDLYNKQKPHCLSLRQTLMSADFNYKALLLPVGTMGLIYQLEMEPGGILMKAPSKLSMRQALLKTSR